MNLSLNGPAVLAPYDTDKRATMEIDAECKVVQDPFGLERSLWEKLET